MTDGRRSGRTELAAELAAERAAERRASTRHRRALWAADRAELLAQDRNEQSRIAAVHAAIESDLAEEFEAEVERVAATLEADMRDRGVPEDEIAANAAALAARRVVAQWEASKDPRHLAGRVGQRS